MTRYTWGENIISKWDEWERENNAKSKEYMRVLSRQQTASWTKHEKKRVLITSEWVSEKIYFSFLFFFFLPPLTHSLTPLHTDWAEKERERRNDQNIFDDEGKFHFGGVRKIYWKARVSKISLAHDDVLAMNEYESGVWESTTKFF